MADVAIEVFALTKTFSKGKRRTRALNDACLCVNEGEMVALIGASGSGKSTLIRHMIGLTTADAEAGPCCVTVLGKPVQDHGRMSSGVRAVRAEVGVIFQQFNLIGRLSLLTNVLLGLLGHISAWRGSLGLFTDGEKRLAMEALHRVGMHEYAGQRASTLSGGQQQRAAIARALVQQASVILADEPIASLDPESARRVMENLARINREDGTTVVVSLHQVDFAIRYCPRTVAMRDGRIIYDGPSKALTPEFLRDLYGADSEDLILAGPLGSKAFGEDPSAPVFAVAEAVG